MGHSKGFAQAVRATCALSALPVAMLSGACAPASSLPASTDGGSDPSGDAGEQASPTNPVDPFDAGSPLDASTAATNGDSGAASGEAGAGANGDSGASSSPPGWTLVWSDEFSGADGTPVDPSKWQHETGGNNANHELEDYTDSLASSQQRGGNLVITADTDGQGGYTSARINTAGQFTQQYGRFEARAQLPYGQGIWPAFWMLGSNIDQVSWPACGEIDIMETIGTDVGENHGSLHSPGWDPSGVYPLPDGAKLSDAFHTYAIEWDPGEIRFYVDDNLYETQDEGSAPDGAWVFGGQPFFIIINVAVGGDWPGAPDSTTSFPQRLLVDWVRVYQRAG
jgi:beta-glucanase (GH16 family)